MLIAELCHLEKVIYKNIHVLLSHNISFRKHKCFYPPPKDLGGIVLALSVRPKPFRLSCFSVRTHILVMDFQILLSFYRNMYLHMRTAHTRFGCTAPTGNRVMALLLLSNIHSTQINFLSGRISHGFSDFIITCRRFQGDIVLALSVRLSSFPPFGRHCEVTCLLPLTKWKSCQLLAKI